MRKFTHEVITYFTVVRPQSVTGEGLFKDLGSGLQCLGINEIASEKCNKLVGIGTDGASGESGLKGRVESHLPYILDVVHGSLLGTSSS